VVDPFSLDRTRSLAAAGDGRVNILLAVDDALYASALAPFLAEVDQLRPDGGELIDAHTHLGLDEDGRSLTVEQLLAMLDAAGARRACVFPLHDPERRPAYRVPNDRVLQWARESDARLIPFCRLDPAEEPLAEGERCLSDGARGIKLHPRAQDFVFDGQEIDAVFGLAESANVPILIHAGRGLPPLAEGLVALALRHPGAVLILAHGAICDQGILTTRLADHPGVLYDISCFFPLDVIELFARVPAERIVFASDPPYGRPAPTLYLALRVARQAGLDEGTTRAFLGETMAGLLDSSSLPPATPARRGPSVTLSGRLARVYGYASLVGPALFTGATEQARAMLDLALAACRDPDPGSDGEALDAIGAALGAADKLLGEEDGVRAAIDLVYRSNARAATEIRDGT
jgi:predicted TIM-barrel fold metal-dependent hydrolase